MGSNRVAAALGSISILVAACAGSSVRPAATTPAPTLSSTRAPASASVPSAEATFELQAGCSEDHPCRLHAGTWTLAGSGAFVQGLMITLPDRWTSVAQNAGEFKLIAWDHPDDEFFMWRDVVAITNDGTARIVPNVPSTPEGLTAFFRGDPDLTVSTPTTTNIAGGIPAITYVVGVSASAKSPATFCPNPPHCVDFLRDAVHWAASDVYGIAAPEVARLYLATIGTGSNTHLLVIALDSPNATELARFSTVVDPIVASIRLPAVVAFPAG
jgi:hypothetical protein